MKLSDFDFSLPEDLIATRPARPRSSARMMVCDAGARSDATMIDLPRWLVPGDRLVLNDTRVLPARLAGRRFREGADGVTSAAIEATLLRPAADGTWTALVRPQKRLREGETVVFSDRLSARLVGRDGDLAILAFDRAGAEFETELDAAGQMPLPPYIAARRPADAQDRSDYQTLWGVRPGSVAAPTASLHFDAPLLEALAARGIETTHVTLHVGAGTFLPVKVEDIAAHRMHAEWGEVGARAAAEINATIAAGGRIVPVGTTALRLIESAATGPGRIAAWQGETDIFIRPGFAFALTDALVTNFHLPRSTLLMLVSALMGVETMRDVYAHAIAERYRFFSYGDGSLLVPPRMRRLG